MVFIFSGVRCHCAYYLNKDLVSAFKCMCIIETQPLSRRPILTMKFHAPLHFFNQYLLSTCCVPSTMLDAGNTIEQGSTSVLKMLLMQWISGPDDFRYNYAIIQKFKRWSIGDFQPCFFTDLQALKENIKLTYSKK